MDRPPHLDIDLNKTPSPSPSPSTPPSPPREIAAPVVAPPPQLPPPANVPAQKQLAHQAREIALPTNVGNGGGRPLSPRPRPQGRRWSAASSTSAAPGAAGWGGNPCASCGLLELPAATICDACERGFHESCVNVRCPPPPVPTPGVRVRRPQVAVNEDWLCPECEIDGARRAVPLHTNEDPVAVTIQEITRQLCQLPLIHFLMLLDLLFFSEF
ncbi:hypothetical protein ZWY2020_019444 [Hordeum vulgare]|nr:hypothetical protein ZWY2020_019444 [Hordeum vulgare]